jgi:hypothetical protein
MFRFKNKRLGGLLNGPIKDWYFAISGITVALHWLRRCAATARAEIQSDHSGETTP